MTLAHAPGKVILFGEHAVVYGRPAIAVPVTQVQATARVEPGDAGQGVIVVAPDLGRRIRLRGAKDDEPLAHIVRLTLALAKADPDPDLTITVTSTVPVARGMGSGAAVSTAIVRALSRHFGYWLSSRAISDLVFQTEVLYHGTPSGIDNTVISFEKPIYYVKDEGWEVFWVGAPLFLAIADTGVVSSTREVVADLRQRHQAAPSRHSSAFDQIGEIVVAARASIEQGELEVLGGLMDQNHALLQRLGVSCPELDRLVSAARSGGALGAKMSGAGWGGNMIALVTEATQGRVDMALRLAGATHVMVTKVR
ncbi:MAG: mevalonate kinase [Anaerolineae bacterium]|nr:mevalonate kinase [Anaerolineae bacterium]